MAWVPGDVPDPPTAAWHQWWITECIPQIPQMPQVDPCPTLPKIPGSLGAQIASPDSWSWGCWAAEVEALQQKAENFANHKNRRHRCQECWQTSRRQMTRWWQWDFWYAWYATPCDTCEAIDPGFAVHLAHLCRPVSKCQRNRQRCRARFPRAPRCSSGRLPCWPKCPKATSTGSLVRRFMIFYGWRWMKIAKIIHQNCQTSTALMLCCTGTCLH